jgi:uncharacterized protein GlcG (DUF336 family)
LLSYSFDHKYQGFALFVTDLRSYEECPVIDYSDAKKLVDLHRRKSGADAESVVVAVADPHGELIAFARMDGAPIPKGKRQFTQTTTTFRKKRSTSLKIIYLGTAKRGLGNMADAQRDHFRCERNNRHHSANGVDLLPRWHLSAGISNEAAYSRISAIDCFCAT